MTTRVLLVDPSDPREDRLAQAAEFLRAGSVVALPTETVYGLAVDPFSPAALAALNALKRKAKGSPALLLLADKTQVPLVARDLSESFHRLADAFWPGPLTLVVPASHDLPAEVSGGRGTVGVRVPGLLLPRHLARAMGRPVTGVSANLYGNPPCRTASEVAREFPEGIAMILDGGPTAGGTSSTVLDLSRPVPEIVRAGAIPLNAIRPFLPDL